MSIRCCGRRSTCCPFRTGFERHPATFGLSKQLRVACPTRWAAICAFQAVDPELVHPRFNLLLCSSQRADTRTTNACIRGQGQIEDLRVNPAFKGTTHRTGTLKLAWQDVPSAAGSHLTADAVQARLQGYS